MPGNTTAWACLILGIVVMWFTMMFVTRYLTDDANARPRNLAKILVLLLSGTVLGFLTAQLGAEAKEFAWYAIGLGVGLLIYAIAYFLRHGWFPTRTTGPGPGPQT